MTGIAIDYDARDRALGPSVDLVIPEHWTLVLNPECVLTLEDWIHLRKIEASGSLDFWLDKSEDIYE
ncbi:MAG: hypothetical protein FJY73_07170 [Candidatus Eisenbacteria bacterium]|nr:hypothetical protein [Candidatus Eisenbacteria bacterium]